MKFTNVITVLCALSFASEAFAKKEKSEKDKKGKKSDEKELVPFVATEESCSEVAEGMVEALYKMVEDFDEDELEDFVCSSMERKTALLPVFEDPKGAIEDEYGEYAACVELILEDFIEDLQDPDTKDYDLQFALDPDMCREEVKEEVAVVKEMRRELLRMRNLRGGDRKLFWDSIKRFFSRIVRRAPAIISAISRGRSLVCRFVKVPWIC